MSAIEINRKLFILAVNRLRVQLFGDESLKILGMVPETGEAVIAELPEDWCGREIESPTEGAADTNAWQFKIIAADDWQTSQAYLLKNVSFKIGDRRWKTQKVKKPIGNSKVWKLKAQIQ